MQALSSATDLESADTDGKWAEEDSEVSSVDEFDSISVKGRRQEFQARRALALSETPRPQDGADSADDRKLDKGSKDGGSKKTVAARTKASSVNKEVKKGKIRFKEEGKSGDNQKMGKDGKKVAKKGQEEEEVKKDDASDAGEPKEEKRNKYLDEWLGIKREPVDTRYQPGKPPPNR